MSERAPPTELERLQSAYQRVLGAVSEDAVLVLGDLRRFCGYDADAFDEGSVRQTDYNLGKRRVFLRIAQNLAGQPEKRSAIEAEDVEGRELAPIAET